MNLKVIVGGCGSALCSVLLAGWMYRVKEEIRGTACEKNDDLLAQTSCI
jgi:hypothetical protein